MLALIMTLSSLLISGNWVLGNQSEEAPKKKVYRETQEVDFDGVDIDGVVRKPDGAYLNPKRGVDFIPLYQVKKQIDENIKDSIEFLR